MPNADMAATALPVQIITKLSGCRVKLGIGPLCPVASPILQFCKLIGAVVVFFYSTNDRAKTDESTNGILVLYATRHTGKISSVNSNILQNFIRTKLIQTFVIKHLRIKIIPEYLGRNRCQPIFAPA